MTEQRAAHPGNWLIRHYDNTCAFGARKLAPAAGAIARDTNRVMPDPELARPVEIDPDLALSVSEANVLAPWDPEGAADESREESFDPW